MQQLTTFLLGYAQTRTSTRVFMTALRESSEKKGGKSCTGDGGLFCLVPYSVIKPEFFPLYVIHLSLQCVKYYILDGGS
jgi:hypothetical protein